MNKAHLDQTLKPRELPESWCLGSGSLGTFDYLYLIWCDASTQVNPARGDLFIATPAPIVFKPRRGDLNAGQVTSTWFGTMVEGGSLATGRHLTAFQTKEPGHELPGRAR